MITLTALPLTAQAFGPFGEVLTPGPGQHGTEIALDLSQGKPRYSVMRLAARPMRFTSIPRHQRVTQCLGAVGGHDWYIAVAAPESDPSGAPSAIVAFLIPGDAVIKLHRGTWHAGPHFDGVGTAAGPNATTIDFTNLELSDTNEADFDVALLADEFEIAATQSPTPFYSTEMRAFQDHFDSRRLADRLEEMLITTTFDDRTRDFIERASMFFLGTADAHGAPDCSYKGGRPGFVRILDESTLAFPFYDGNGMYRSLGNIASNPAVGLLFVDFETPDRHRVNGIASLHRDPESLALFPGAEVVVRVRTGANFRNCGRYVHDLRSGEISAYVPDAQGNAPVPEWKSYSVFADVLPGAPRPE